MSDKEKVKATPAPVAADADESTEAPPKRPSAIMAIVKAAAFVSILVIVQVVGASMLIPSAKETERLAHKYVAATAGESTRDDAHHDESQDSGHGHDDSSEVELGSYNITHFNPATNSTLSIDFELYASVLASDTAEFGHLFEKSKVRVREQVIMTLHAAEAKDLSDAGLGLIKRQILEKTNRALGRPMVREVLFSKFNYVER